MTKRTKVTETDSWKILAPLVGPILVAVLGWFLVNNYNDQKEINKLLFKKCNDQASEYAVNHVDFEKRLGIVEYALRSKNGRFQ